MMNDVELRKVWVRCLVCLQFGIPAVLLGLRWVTGEISLYGLGWQMFSS